MTNRNHPFTTWREFTAALDTQYGPSPHDCPRPILFKLTQTGIAKDYHIEFVALANRVYGVSSYALLDYFIGGLYLDIRRRVLARSLINLIKVVALAKLFEEECMPISSPKQWPAAPKTNHTSNTVPSRPLQYTPALKQNNQPPLLPTPNTEPLAIPLKPNPIKKMSPTELKLRWERSLSHL